MSFSSKIKEELLRKKAEKEHCAIAELAAIISACGKVKNNLTSKKLIIISENKLVIDKCVILIEQIFKIQTTILTPLSYDTISSAPLIEIEQEQLPLKVAIPKEQNRKANEKRNNWFSITIENQDEIERITNNLNKINELDVSTNQLMTDNQTVKKMCCKRAFIRGAFLATGSMSNPEKTYHFEVVFQSQACAKQLVEIIRFFSVETKIIKRKKYFVVYMKESAGIVELLNVMEAHKALMELENIRIYKEVRNSVNRQVNCETANINKTVLAAGKQIEDILCIRDRIGFENLSEGLEEIAKLRITYPEATLKELGEMLTLPIGKSGVNHRLKKLSSIAKDLTIKKQ